MTWLGWFLIALSVYLAIGAGVAWMLMQTPYAANGWLIILLL